MKKRFFTMLALAAALCACNKIENTIPEVQTPEEIQYTPLVFTASMEGAPETKATYDAKYKCASWEEGDQISIDDIIYQANTAGTSTTFSPVVDAEEVRPTFVSSTNTGSYQNQPAQNLVDDGGVDTRWIANKTDMVNGVWNIVVTTGKTTQLKSIKLWNHDNATNPGRRWKSMKLYGSTSSDGEWAEIQSFSNLNLAINNRGLAGEIEVNATEGYTHYRIDVLDNEGDKSGWMQMSDMKFVVTPTVNAPYDAYFPASLYDGSIASLPANYTETWEDGQFNMPMYAHSENTELHFKNLCGVLAIAVPSTQMSSVTSIVVTSDQQMNGAISSITDEGVLTFAPATLTDAEKKITLIASSAVTIDSGNSKTFYVPVPAGTHNPLKITVSDGTIEKVMATKKRGGVAVERNKIYPITFAENYPAGALPEEFTVEDPDGVPNSGDEKKVLFSKGNLYYDGSKCNFEANQYDFRTYPGHGSCISGTYSEYSGTPTNHCGLFTWSSTVDAAAGTSNNGDFLFTNADGFKVNVGGTDQTGWRTLSTNEWRYLFNGRNNASNLYKCGVTVCGVTNCVVIAPDGWDLSANSLQSEYSSTSTPMTWEQAETAGLVCLPAAGSRLGSNIHDAVGCTGFYWSSTAYNEYNVWFVTFTRYNLFHDGGDYYRGCSVRLITKSN